MEHNQRFFGVWELEPASCQYSMGVPPKSGKYEIQPEEDTLKFILSWSDEERPFLMEFTAIPDGEPHPFANPALADSMTVGYRDDNILESWSYKDDLCLGYSKRELIGDGSKMMVSQEVDTADGKLINRSIYRRV